MKEQRLKIKKPAKLINHKSPQQAGLITLLLLAGFGLSLLLRLIMGGEEVRTSSLAGLVFAGSLLALVVAIRTKADFSRKILLTGIAGAAVLVLPVWLGGGMNLGQHTPAGNFWWWAAVVSIVAIVEEAYLRGVLFDCIDKWLGYRWAIAIAALIFALMHVPIYGWQVLPLDFVVGGWLGILRQSSGSFVAPGITHCLADLAGWWLR